MKYFFLADGWTIGRIWESGGLWSEAAWRRLPQLEMLQLCLWENDEQLWLYRVEAAVLMVEVKPPANVELPPSAIGQVVLKRLITADQVVEKLCGAQLAHSA